jgi:hypothetical protein
VERNLKIVGIRPPAFPPQPTNRVEDIPGSVPKELGGMTDDAEKFWSRDHGELCQRGPQDGDMPPSLPRTQWGLS